MQFKHVSFKTTLPFFSCLQWSLRDGVIFMKRCYRLHRTSFSPEVDCEGVRLRSMSVRLLSPVGVFKIGVTCAINSVWTKRVTHTEAGQSKDSIYYYFKHNVQDLVRWVSRKDHNMHPRYLEISLETAYDHRQLPKFTGRTLRHLYKLSTSNAMVR